MIERLEDRRLLAAVYFDPDSQSIKIRAGEGDDRISVIRRGDRVLVQLNDRRRWFDLAGVKWLDVWGAGGNDFISAQYTPFKAQLYGGDGCDTIIGGWGDDHIDGGDNADRLIGHYGDDELRGDVGADRMIGGAGRDILRGGNGNDWMSGGGGDDYLMSSVGDDRFDGGAGADTAVHFEGRGQLSGVEGHTFVGEGDDPFTHLSVQREADGSVSVLVAATHYMGGYKRHFGELVTRVGEAFGISLIGDDLAGPDGGRTAMVETQHKTYALGNLADGTYTFTAESDVRVLATVTIRIVNGALVQTPTWPGEYPSTPVRIS